MKTIDEIHNYWIDPDDNKNNPDDYVYGYERTCFLVEKIKSCNISKETGKILEIGCNVGRNLNGLNFDGYKNLFGIEISEIAVKKMEQYYNKMFLNSSVFVGPAEMGLVDFKPGSMDLIYTMAVLEHIHPDSEDFIFSRMVNTTKKYIITIEDEHNISDRHFVRNYKDAFGNLGMKEIESCRCSKIPGLGKKYYYRVFEK